MAYIDYKYYLSEYMGTEITLDQFMVLSERASDLIDMLTSYSLSGVDLTQQHQLIQTNLKKSVAAQIEYMASQGGELTMHGGSPSSVKIGNFSYQEGTEKDKQIVSPAVINYLRPTGLLYRGVNLNGC